MMIYLIGDILFYFEFWSILILTINSYNKRSSHSLLGSRDNYSSSSIILKGGIPMPSIGEYIYLQTVMMMMMMIMSRKLIYMQLYVRKLVRVSSGPQVISVSPDLYIYYLCIEQVYKTKQAQCNFLKVSSFARQSAIKASTATYLYLYRAPSTNKV